MICVQMKDYWYRAISGVDPAFGHKTALCGWIGGPEGAYMESLPEEVIGEVCTNLLRHFTGISSIPLPKKVIR